MRSLSSAFIYNSNDQVLKLYLKMFSNGTVVSSCPIPSRVMPPENWTQMPESSLGQTPGGTIFSTTPGDKNNSPQEPELSTTGSSCWVVGTLLWHAPLLPVYQRYEGSPSPRCTPRGNWRNWMRATKTFQPTRASL